MTKDKAIREARIAALYQGGTFYVVRRVAQNYTVVSADNYTQRMGRIALQFTPEKVRQTVPGRGLAAPKP